MPEEKKSSHGTGSSRWTFILAATGSAVGLGNIWKFPYMAGDNGGGAFVLVYLACIAVIGLRPRRKSVSPSPGTATSL